MEAKKLFFTSMFNELSGYQIEVREKEPIEGNVNRHFFKTVDELLNYEPPEDKNVYYGVYSRGWKYSGKAWNCKKTNAIFLDFDDLKLSEVKNRIIKSKLPKPSTIISSGNGYHIYWFLRKATFSNITGLLRQLVETTGADIKATDKARVMRLPGTLNCGYTPTRKCKIINIYNKKYDLSDFGFAGNIKPNKNFKPIKNLKIKRQCVKEMLKGVPDGFRHFSLGRITKYLQQKGYRQNDVEQTVLDWNQRNDPPLKEKDILESFIKYWITDYKLLGCKIPDIKDQARLNRFCNKPECQFRYFGAKLNYNKSIGLHNRIFNNYSKISGYDIILYSLLKRHSEGLNSSQIEEKITSRATEKPCMSKKTKSKSLNNLKKLGFIEIINGNRKAGKENFYRYKKQGTFGLGFTIVTNGMINGAIYKQVTATELKIYVLLHKYCNEGISFPSLRTLSKETRTTPQAISNHIKSLEKAEYLNKFIVYNEKGAETRIYELLV